MDAKDTQGKPLISVILSFRNEELVIPALIQRLQASLDPLELSYELIFVDDDSTDRSASILSEHAARDDRIKVITMARKFGVAECILAGLSYSRGEAAIYMDTDLQDPPEVIPQLIEKWRQGAEIVNTIRTRREGETAFKKKLTAFAYRLIRVISAEADLPVEAGDFKLLSRRAVKQMLALPESDPYLRGLVRWIGFRQEFVPYERKPRAGGKSHFPCFAHLIRDLLSLRGPAGTFIIGITSFSMFPLLFFLFLGMLFILASTVAAAILGILALAGIGISGILWLILLAVFLTGIQLSGIGTLGLYLARIYRDARGRPRYIVENARGFDREGSK